MTQNRNRQQNKNRKSVGRNYWMFVESPENFEIIKEMGVTLFGMGPKYRQRAERMAPNDRVLFYVKGIRKWPATATISSTCFQDDSPVFKRTFKGEGFNYRVKLTPNIVLDEPDYIDAMLLAPRLQYLKRWVPEDWPLAFVDRLHLLPQKDFRLVEGEMQRIKPRGRALPRPERGESEEEFLEELEEGDGSEGDADELEPEVEG
jgi:hypothetical protein